MPAKTLDWQQSLVEVKSREYILPALKTADFLIKDFSQSKCRREYIPIEFKGETKHFPLKKPPGFVAFESRKTRDFKCGY